MASPFEAEQGETRWAFDSLSYRVDREDEEAIEAAENEGLAIPVGSLKERQAGRKPVAGDTVAGSSPAPTAEEGE